MAQITDTGTYYYHTDHLQSSSVITDSNGNSAQEIFYYPYGEIKTSSGSIDFKHKYTGKEWDAETGLYYYGARYYDPRLTRFISADTIVPLPFYPQSFNRYAYGYNNPVVVQDLNGNCGWFGSAVSAVRSFFSSVGHAIASIARGAVSIGQRNAGATRGPAPSWGYGYSLTSQGTYPISQHAAYAAQQASVPAPPGKTWSSYYGGQGSLNAGNGDSIPLPPDPVAKDFWGNFYGDGNGDLMFADSSKFETNRIKSTKGKGVAGTAGDILADEASKLQWFDAHTERYKALDALAQESLNIQYGESKEFSVITTYGTWATPPQFLYVIEGRNWVNFIIDTSKVRIMDVITVHGVKGAPPLPIFPYTNKP